MVYGMQINQISFSIKSQSRQDKANLLLAACSLQLELGHATLEISYLKPKNSTAKSA